jgi:GNAT superfamily N-acetyltransferase
VDFLRDYDEKEHPELSSEESFSRGQIKRLDSLECDEMARALGDTPETATAVHVLRRGLCSAYFVSERNYSDAVVIQPTRLPEEPTAFGSDAEAIGSVLAGLSGWTCINVDESVGPRLGRIMEARLTRPVRFLGDVYHTLSRPAIPVIHPAVRFLTSEDVGLLAAAPDEVQEAALGFGSFEALLAEGIAAGAVVDGGLVSLACTTAQTEGHADLGVVTAEPWRGQGLATACAALTAERVRRAGRLPVWSTAEDNVASLRVARRLGFEKVSCRTYVIPVVRLPHDLDLPPR